MERKIATSCTRDCPCGCSILVKVKEGEITSHRADPRNTFTGSFLCVKGNRYLKRQNSPDRLLKPMLRKNGSFEPIGWDRALDLIADKLVKTRETSGNLSSLWAQYSGSLSLLNLIMPRIFWIHMGGSTVTQGGISIDALQAAQMHDFGKCLPHQAEDIINSRNIIFWGRNPAVTNIHLIPYLKAAQKNGATLTVIDPRYTETARIADRFISPRPGGDGYLAIAVAREVRRRQKSEPDFARERSNNWDGYMNLLDRYDERDLYARADVTEEEVAYLASAYWDQKPCSTYLGLGVNWWRQGGAHSRLIHSLIYMSGNIGIPGGGANFFNMEFPFGTGIFREEMNKARERGVQLVKPRRILLPILANEIEKAQDPPIRLAWIAMFNPVAVVPDSRHLTETLRKLDFVIVTEQFMTATAKCADLILPVTTYLEEDDVVHGHGQSFTIGPVNAAIPPRGDTRSNFHIFQDLAERLGFGEALAGEPWEWIARAWSPLEDQGISLETVKKGPAKLVVPMVPYQKGKFSTPDGKFNCITEYEGRPDPEPGLTLLMVKRLDVLNSQVLPDEAQERPTVCLNPDVAVKLGLKKGDRIQVESSKDKMEAILKISHKTRKDAVEFYPSVWKNDKGGINRLRNSIISDIGPTAAVNETKVTIRKV